LNAGRQHPRRLPFVKEHRSLPAVDPTKGSDDQLTQQLAKLGETDTDNAQRFAERFGTKVIHTPGRGWLVFDGRRWQPDTLLRAIELAKETARLITNEAAHVPDDAARAARSRFAQQTLAKGALDRMMDLARSLLAVDDAMLDADPWLLNVENGTINLRTGRREKHDPRDLLTMMAPVRANRKAKCPTFKKLLRRVTGDDAGLRRFLQKAVGYSLTGITTELCLRQERQQRQVDRREPVPGHARRLWLSYADRDLVGQAVRQQHPRRPRPPWRCSHGHGHRGQRQPPPR
jgi:putative DNA primase/helicase